MRELTPKQLCNKCDPKVFKFRTTAELKEFDEPIGQKRAVAALEFAAAINSDGYNVYVMGQIGTGRSSISSEFLRKRSQQEPTPRDWCYVYNFADSRVPKALSLPAGKGAEWLSDMDAVIGEMVAHIMAAFESEQYNEKRDDILRGFRDERNKELQEFEEEVEAAGFTLGRSPAGLIVAPAHDGEVMDPQQYRELSDEERSRLEDERIEFQGKLAEIMRRGQREERQTRQNVIDLDRDIARAVVEPLLEEIRDKHKDQEAVLQHIDAIQEDLLENVTNLRQTAEDGEDHMQVAGTAGGVTGAMPLMERYRVNLLVNNAQAQGAPVIAEANPTIEALTGEVEHQTHMGALVTDFTMIKPGALHRANGGYLIIEAHQVLQRPYAWDALKRALKSEQIRIESLRDQFRFISTVSLEPAPIPLNVRVILVGSPWLYYLLYEYDEDFRKLFKVKADFGIQIDRTRHAARQYAALVGQMCRQEGLPHFAARAIARVVEYGSRLADNSRKLSLNFSKVSNLVRESAYWASEHGRKVVSADDVTYALEQQLWRSNRIEERILEMLEDGSMLVDVAGSEVGQINGISVLQLGDYALGKASRITCETYLGRAGVVNIEREVKLTGRIHDKGILTIGGFVGGRYGQDVPISLSASLAFEQLYDEVDGDSAASTELYALLSSLADVPIKQGIAVTGSVNQKGEIQPVGGVNHKIEGFYATCKTLGITGDQGVIIPHANLRNLMLSDEVVEAVEKGQFHIWVVKTVDEGIELLTGVKAGTRGKSGKYPKNTINGLVEARLQEMAEKMKPARPADKTEPTQ